MKNLLLCSLSTFLLFSCNKLTNENIVGTWKLTEFTVNGASNLPSYEVTIDFKSDGTHITYGDGTIIYSGSYSVNKQGQKLNIDGQVYDITEKKSKKMTWQITLNGSTLVYTYEK